MCLTAPARVVAVEADTCLVAVAQRTDRVSTLMADLDDLRVGDWVLVSGGALIRRLETDQAAQMQEAFQIAFDRDPPSPTKETDR